MQAGVAISHGITIIQIILSSLKQILIDFIVFRGPSWSFTDAVEKMMTEMQTPILQQFSTMIMTF